MKGAAFRFLSAWKGNGWGLACTVRMLLHISPVWPWPLQQAALCFMD